MKKTNKTQVNKGNIVRSNVETGKQNWNWQQNRKNDYRTNEDNLKAYKQQQLSNARKVGGGILNTNVETGNWKGMQFIVPEKSDRIGPGDIQAQEKFFAGQLKETITGPLPGQRGQNAPVKFNNNNNWGGNYNQNYNNNNNYSYNQNYNNYNTNNFNNNNNIENNNKYSTNHIYNNNNIYSLNNEDNNNIYNNYSPLNNNNNNIFTINNKNPIINNNNNNNKYPLYDSNNFKDDNNDNNNNNIYIKNQPFIVTNESVQICEEEPINENMITSEEKFNPTCEYENTNKEKARKDANNFLLES
jgi:hypothetical protein